MFDLLHYKTIIMAFEADYNLLSIPQINPRNLTLDIKNQSYCHTGDETHCNKTIFILVLKRTSENKICARGSLVA